jgi:hypothetical protein
VDSSSVVVEDSCCSERNSHPLIQRKINFNTFEKIDSSNLNELFHKIYAMKLFMFYHVYITLYDLDFFRDILHLFNNDLSFAWLCG